MSRMIANGELARIQALLAAVQTVMGTWRAGVEGRGTVDDSAMYALDSAWCALQEEFDD